VLLERSDQIVRNDLERPKVGPKGGGQDARSNVVHRQAPNNEKAHLVWAFLFMQYSNMMCWHWRVAYRPPSVDLAGTELLFIHKAHPNGWALCVSGVFKLMRQKQEGLNCQRMWPFRRIFNPHLVLLTTFVTDLTLV
jgi:hypothetical protein